MTKEKVKHNHSTYRFSKWSSLYNNIHPSRRLPSLSTIFLMIWGIMVLGSQTSSNKSTTINQTTVEKALTVNPANRIIDNNFSNSGNSTRIQKTAVIDAKFFARKTQLLKPVVSVEKNNSFIDEKQAENTDKQNSNGVLPTGSLFYSVNNDKQVNAKYGRQNKKETEENVHFEIYATPSLMNQAGIAFGQKDIGEATSAMNANDDQKPFHLYKTREIEAGGALLFDISSSFRLKAGMQFNFANYTLEQNNQFISNPTYNSNNSIKNNGNALTNAVYQLSIPLGTEWKLVGNGWIDWFAGATVQPSLVLSDPTFFQKDDELMNADGNAVFRKWNVHSTLETFVNYHLTKNTSIKLGPQLRYQLMPSLLPTYNVTERLYNVGLKLGLTGNF